MKISLTLLLLLATSIVWGQKIDSLKLMADLKELSSDRFEGREPGSEGSILAQQLLISRFRELGLKQYHPDYRHGIIIPVRINPRGSDKPSNTKEIKSVNIIGYIPGKQEEAIVISAHYDHVGIINGDIYNGADDNASGVAAMLSIAKYFSKNQPQHTLVFAAFDSEETYLRGSLAFMNEPPLPLDKMKLNINMDLIGTDTDHQLYIGGTFFNPEFKPALDKIWGKSEDILMLYGYDVPGSMDDRTLRSDHALFHAVEIPYLYFGVPEHANYHKPTDDYENISHSFYYKAVELILESLVAVDRDFPVKE